MIRRMLVTMAVILAGAQPGRGAETAPPAGAQTTGPAAEAAPAAEVQMTRPLEALPAAEAAPAVAAPAAPPAEAARETRPAEATIPVSLPDVNNFPELYRGVPITLEDVELQWKIVKEFDYYCLDLTVKEGERNRRAQERGEYTPPFLNRQRVTFVASPEIAREMLDRTELDTAYPVKIWCTVGIADDLIRELGNVYWVARVERIDCYRGDRSVAWSIPSPGSASPALPPIGPEIEKYSGRL